jgi:hypothetical protein
MKSDAKHTLMTRDTGGRDLEAWEPARRRGTGKSECAWPNIATAGADNSERLTVMAQGIYRERPPARSLELVVSRSYGASIGLGLFGVALLTVTFVEPGLRRSGLEIALLGVAVALLFAAFWAVDQKFLILDEGRNRLMLRHRHLFGAEDTVRVLSTLSDAVALQTQRGTVAQLEFADGEHLNVGPPRRKRTRAVGIVDAIHRFLPARAWAPRNAR